jgi:stage II sporulation protein D
MDLPNGTSGLSDWTRAASVEPTVRIGVFLEQDAAASIHLTPVQGAAVFSSPGGPQVTVEPQVPVEIRQARPALSLRIAQQAARTIPSLRVVAAPVAADLRVRRPGDRETGILLHDVPAGRGFHWQKRLDQVLPGTLELTAGRNGIMLVNELPLETYLAGVITAEMNAACPLEFLKAQSIVARSWLLAMSEPKHASDRFDRCNDDCCQRYQGIGGLTASALAAVHDTRGVILLSPTNKVLDANYCKCCGGVTETPWAIWGLDKPGIKPAVDAPQNAPERRFFPVTDGNLDEYLDGDWLKASQVYCGPAVVPPDSLGRYLGRVDAPGDYFRWTVRYTRAELEDLLRANLTDAAGLEEVRDILVRARGASGRAYAVQVEWLNADGEPVRSRLDGEYRIRQALHRNFLYSSAFAVRPERDSAGRLSAVVLRGAGWGHGVGLCQIGALGMALRGESTESICSHYYAAARLDYAYT